MRTSLSQQVQNSLMYINLGSSKLLEAQSHVASGKRILKSSDDVPGTNQALNLRSSINTVEQFTNNITVTKPLLKATEHSISQLAKAVDAVRSIAADSINGTYSEDDLKLFAKQLDQIQAEMVDIANSQHLDQYIFSGTATGTASVVEQAGTPPVAYQGNGGARRVQVLSWVSLNVNIPGSRIFNFDGSAGPGTTDIFTMVQQVKEKILSGSGTAVSAELANIDDIKNNLLSCQAQVGSWTARVESAEQTLGDMKARLQQMLSDTEDVDITQAIIDLKTQENVYQAALSVSTRMLELSLASMQR